MAIKPLVFIPGLPGSELRQFSTGKTFFPPSPGDLISETKKKRLVRLLSGPDVPPGDIVAGEPIRSLRLGKIELGKRAEALYDLLRNSYQYTIDGGNNFRAVGWDWRKAIDAPKVQADIVAAIDALSAANGGARVVVLVHSTGGLLLRRLLEQQPSLVAKIEQILALGVPWAGTLAAVKLIAKGEKFGFGPVSLSAANVREALRRSQAAYDLFPPDPAPGKADLRDSAGRPLNLFVADGPNPRQMLGPLVDLRWVRPADPQVAAMATDADGRLGIRPSEISLSGTLPVPPITNIAGWGVTMETTAVLSTDGVLTFEETKQGDGTVPVASVSWLRGAGVRTFFVPVGIYPSNGIPFHHSLIWSSPPVRQLFDEVLADRAKAPYVCGSADSDETIDSQSDVTIRLVAEDPSGKPLPQARYQFKGLMTQPKSFGGEARIDAPLKRASIRPDPQGLFRFVVEVLWGNGGEGERREIPILFKR